MMQSSQSKNRTQAIDTSQMVLKDMPGKNKGGSIDTSSSTLLSAQDQKEQGSCDFRDDVRRIVARHLAAFEPFARLTHESSDYRDDVKRVAARYLAEARHKAGLDQDGKMPCFDG